MAKANTYEMDKGGGYFWDKRGCHVCGGKPVLYRGFYYPTYMNGDAEWLGDYCEQHKNTNLENVQNGKTKTLYLDELKKSW